MDIKIPVFAIGTVATRHAIEQAGGALDGVYVTAFCTDGVPEKFREEFEKRYGAKPGFFAQIGYDLAALLRDAASRGGLSPQDLRAGLESVKDLPLTTGTVSTNGERDITIPMCVKQIVDGRIKNLETGNFSDY